MIEPAGRLFLFRYDNVEVGVHWSMPGGGLDEGETAEVGAQREVREETGWSDIEVGSAWFSWQHDYTRPEGPVRQSETVYLARALYTARRDLVGDLSAAHQADGILRWHWWSSDELASATEQFWPPTLPSLFASLLVEGAPSRPIALGYFPNDLPLPGG